MNVRLAPLLTAISVGFATLRVNPLRTVLSTLGVIIGVSALVAVLSVGDGMERSVRTQIEQTTDLHAISVNARTMEEVDGQMFPLANPAQLTVVDARAFRALEGVQGVLLRSMAPSEVRNHSGTTRRMAMVASEVALVDSARVTIAYGRLLTLDEAAGDAPRVVISWDLARAVAPDSTATAILGDSIILGTTAVEVVGVLAPREPPPVALARRPIGDFRVFAPLGLTSMSVPTPVQRPSITIISATVEETQSVRGRVEQLLAARDSAWQKRYAVTTNESRLEQLSRGILMFKLFMGAITGISLLVGGIGIMNVLLSSVTERTREIGIRKAAGARDRDILRQFLAESVAISAVGSGLGLVLGVSGAYGITAAIRNLSDAPALYASVSWSTVAVAAIAAVLVGLTFGTYPARRAARLSPIDAIRHE